MSRTPATPARSPSSSLAGQCAVNISANSIDETEIDEGLPLKQALDKSGGQRKKGKEPVGNPGKTEEALEGMTMTMSQQMTRTLNEQNGYFSRKRKSQFRRKKSNLSKKDDKQSKEEEMLKELIKTQTEAAKSAEEEKYESMSYRE